jgi:hypothetical protein
MDHHSVVLCFLWCSVSLLFMAISMTVPLFIEIVTVSEPEECAQVTTLTDEQRYVGINGAR